MPPGWIHETIDMIAWGRIYWSVHERKDRFWRELGIRHRIKEHPLYQQGLAGVRQGISIGTVLNCMYDCAKEITKSDWENDLSPDVIEAHQAEMAHDCWDLTWDTFTPTERFAIANALRDVVLRPQAYTNLFEPQDYDAMHSSGPWQKLQNFVRGMKSEELI